MAADAPRRPPTAFLIGAQKAGTTTLAGLLDQHPDVCLARPKEPHYFSLEYARGEAWYDACFAHGKGRLRLDASTTYAMLATTEAQDEAWSARVPERIHARHPDARFLYVLRDPVDRAWSAYWHERRAGRERRAFRQAMDEDRAYLGNGRYAERLARFLALFDRERFLLLDFRELVRDPAGTARRSAAFLGLSTESVTFTTDVPRNASRRYTLPVRVLRGLLGSEARLGAVTDAVRRALPGACTRALERLGSRPIPRLPDADREALAPGFVEDGRRLRAMTDLDIDW